MILGYRVLHSLKGPRSFSIRNALSQRRRYQPKYYANYSVDRPLLIARLEEKLNNIMCVCAEFFLL